MSVTLQNLSIDPVSPWTTFPSLLDFELPPLPSPATPKSSGLGSFTVFLTTNPGTSNAITTQKKFLAKAGNAIDSTFLVYTDENGKQHLKIANPFNSLIPQAGSYTITLPEELFNNLSLDQTTYTLSVGGAVAYESGPGSKATSNPSNYDGFGHVGTNFADLLVGGTGGDYFEGGSGSDTLRGEGYKTLATIEDEKIKFIYDDPVLNMNMAFYNKDKSNFTVTQGSSADTFYVTDKKNGDKDTLIGINAIVFKSDALQPERNDSNNEYRYIGYTPLTLTIGKNSSEDNHIFYLDAGDFNDSIDQASLAAAINLTQHTENSDAWDTAGKFLDGSTWFNLGAGDDRVYAGAGSDGIDGSLGNDTIDGGEDGFSISDQWRRIDSVDYTGLRSQFTIEHKTDSNGSVTGITGKPYVKVTDNQADKTLNQGTDILINVEKIWLQDLQGSGTDINLTSNMGVWRNQSETATANIRDSIFDDSIRTSDFLNQKLYASDKDLVEFSASYFLEDGNGKYLNTAKIDNFWIETKDGNDLIEFNDAGTAGGNVHLGAGNDTVKGYQSIDASQYWQQQVTVSFQGSSKRYTIQKLKDNTDAYYYSVTDKIADSVGGTGVDRLYNVNRIQFSNQSFDLNFSSGISSSGYGEYNPSTQQYVYTQIESGLYANGTTFDDVIGAQTSIAGTQRDKILNFEGDDNITGGAGNDLIYGNEGSDGITGGAGNDTIDGGGQNRLESLQKVSWTNGGMAGVDVARYSGASSRYVIDYNFSYNGENYIRVTDSKITGGEGVDLLKNIEILQFNNNNQNQYVYLKNVTEKQTWGFSFTSTNGNWVNLGETYRTNLASDGVAYQGHLAHEIEETIDIEEHLASPNFSGEYRLTLDFDGMAKITLPSDQNHFRVGDLVQVSSLVLSEGGSFDEWYPESYPYTSEILKITSTTIEFRLPATDQNFNLENISQGIIKKLIHVRDEIYGSAGGDSIDGQGGYDYIAGGQGNDTINGGDRDAYINNSWSNGTTVSYDAKFSRFLVARNEDDSITVTDKLPGSLGGLGTDTLRNIHYIQFSDQQISTQAQVSTSGSVRYISGSILGDQINYSEDTEEYTSYVSTQGGNDTVLTGNGNDTINLQGGNDSVDGGVGYDNVNLLGNRMRYEIEKTGSFSFVVTDKLASINGVYDTKYISNVETLRFGSDWQPFYLAAPAGNGWSQIGTDFNDSLIVSSALFSGWANVEGGLGNDTIEITNGGGSRFRSVGSFNIVGGAGNDTLDGSTGADSLQGGAGNGLVHDPQVGDGERIRQQVPWVWHCSVFPP